MKRDTLGAIELKILLEKGIVEVFRDTDVIDSLRIAEKITKDDITLQKAVINEYKSLQEHIFNGETIFLRFNDSIQKGKTDKDGNEGHWITTQDGNKAFIGGDGKLRFSAEQISAYVDEKESKENVKEEVKDKKKLDELINLGILPNDVNKIPMPGNSNRDKYESIIRNSNAYDTIFKEFTKNKIVGSDKQIRWATEIRNKIADRKAFELTNKLYFKKINSPMYVDFDYKKAFNSFLSEFKNANASYWIDNRYA